jgi:hypothetical protein
MTRRTIVVDSEIWKVYPTGRITVYGKDEFGLLFELGTGPERKRRCTRYSPLGSKSTDAPLAELAERQLLDFFPLGHNAHQALGNRAADSIRTHHPHDAVLRARFHTIPVASLAAGPAVGRAIASHTHGAAACHHHCLAPGSSILPGWLDAGKDALSSHYESPRSNRPARENRTAPRGHSRRSRNAFSATAPLRAASCAA